MCTHNNKTKSIEYIFQSAYKTYRSLPKNFRPKNDQPRHQANHLIRDAPLIHAPRRIYYNRHSLRDCWFHFRTIRQMNTSRAAPRKAKSDNDRIRRAQAKSSKTKTLFINLLARFVRRRVVTTTTTRQTEWSSLLLYGRWLYMYANSSSTTLKRLGHVLCTHTHTQSSTTHASMVTHRTIPPPSPNIPRLVCALSALGVRKTHTSGADLNLLNLGLFLRAAEIYYGHIADKVQARAVESATTTM